MLLIVTHKNIKNIIFLKFKNPITMHIAHVIGFLFLLKIREILIFNIRFTAFIKILPVGELPNHGHTASTDNINLIGSFRLDGTEVGGNTYANGVFSIGSSFTPSKGDGSSGGGSNAGRNINFSSTHSHKITINNVGEGQSHNNIQPFISVYIWKRTA